VLHTVVYQHKEEHWLELYASVLLFEILFSSVFKIKLNTIANSHFLLSHQCRIMSNSKRKTNTHTHTHTHMNTYTYVHIFGNDAPEWTVILKQVTLIY
jgi:hypothetical protein